MPDALLALVGMLLFYGGYRVGLWNAREEARERERYNASLWHTEG